MLKLIRGALIGGVHCEEIYMDSDLAIEILHESIDVGTLKTKVRTLNNNNNNNVDDKPKG